MRNGFIWLSVGLISASYNVGVILDRYGPKLNSPVNSRYDLNGRINYV